MNRKIGGGINSGMDGPNGRGHFQRRVEKLGNCQLQKERNRRCKRLKTPQKEIHARAVLGGGGKKNTGGMKHVSQAARKKT